MNYQIKQLLDDVSIGVLATADQQGSPWATPLHIAHDDSYVYWFSQEQAIHSQNIALQPRVSIVLPQTNTKQGLQGLYIQSLAEKLTPQQRPLAEAAYEQKFGQLPEFLKTWPAYRAAIGEINEQKSHGNLWYLMANSQAN